MNRFNDRFAIVFLAAFATWVFVALPVLYGGPTNNHPTKQPQNASAPQASQEAPDKLTDWLLVIFNGLLFASTVLLWIANNRSARTAERALTELERPHVFPVIQSPAFTSIGSGGVDVTAPITYTFANYGKTPAFLTEISERLSVRKRGVWPTPIDPNGLDGRRTPEGLVIGPDKETNPFTLRLMQAVPQSELFEFRNRRGELFLLGYVKYTDTFDNRHTTGFCAQWDWIGGRFVLMGDKRYNYIRTEKPDGRWQRLLSRLSPVQDEAPTPAVAQNNTEDEDAS